ncbi:sulfatase-like hydrolase/transferase [Photobacterium sagamiensis]|uniref:sulfatase-like hydrolase/transferase n=1 Tax=Photobacterium sagamiensis TaxID=2910241 RepID=UPI003D118804
MFKKTLVGGLVTAALLSTSVSASTSAGEAINGSNRAPTTQPNVIVVLLDDVGYADISANGGVYPTPNIDELAANGQNFTDFYMTAPVSSPARASLLTSRVGLRTGMYGDVMPVFDETDKDGLPKSEITMAEMLRDGGYKTFMLGKWHLGIGEGGVEHIPTRHGFQEWYGTTVSNDMFNTNEDYRLKQVKRKFSNPEAFRNPENLKFISERDQTLARDADGLANNEDFQVPLMHSFANSDGSFSDNPVGLLNQNIMTRDYTSRAVEYINNNKDDPFFMYVAYPQGHVPIFRSPDFAGVTATPYGDMMVETDYSMGRIIRSLRMNGIDDNTIVIFTSDNGPWLSYSERGSAGSAKPFREGKSSPYEGGSRVPGIISWSGQIKPGVNNALFSAADIMPTVSAMTGIAMPDVISDGFDQSGNILNGEESPRDFIPIFMRGKLVGFRKGDYKLTYLGVDLIGASKPKPPKMFNIAKNPSERKNLAKKEPKKYLEMKAEAKKYLESLGEPAEPLFDFDD